MEKYLLLPLALVARAVSVPLDPIREWFDARPGARRWLGVFRLGLFQFGVGLSLAPITGTLNRVLIELGDHYHIATAVVGCIDVVDTVVTYANAGHRNLYWIDDFQNRLPCVAPFFLRELVFL